LFASSLSDLKNRGEKVAERGQILSISPGNSRSIAQESGKIWTAPQLLQPIPFKSDRLLGVHQTGKTAEVIGKRNQWVRSTSQTQAKTGIFEQKYPKHPVFA
jgi:hypothetical protein